MDAFEILDLIDEQEVRGERYYEFFSAKTLSLGIYQLAAREDDHQQPHTEDEIYYIVSGRGQIVVGEEDQSVEPGSIIFVEAGVEHRFHFIEEDLTILVFFAPARGSQA